MTDMYSFMMISGEQEKMMMGVITAIGYASSGNKIYMFFTMDALKALTPESEKIVLNGTKNLKYYIDNLVDLAGEDLEITACEFGMRVKGIHEDQFIYKVKVGGVSEFALMSSQSKATLIF
ncbi:DsrE family protein [Metallosphaera hakonensis]|uniref:Peroxiredoxin n=1 Tax=Metallosphaera hakonensis JCM 8857 = DSM 7519 TaxID=1293036 RepID=A0A2U9ISK3_9CREN|nr:DsrE family protein [Metallosphaera hakonensis]AWR99030.1 peroxiredoxin [Metallosphaera hakonensis JCM 8857 = DSM 7519]